MELFIVHSNYVWWKDNRKAKAISSIERLPCLLLVYKALMKKISRLKSKLIWSHSMHFLKSIVLFPSFLLYNNKHFRIIKCLNI